MELHRSSKRPDWAKVAQRRRNWWQQLARRTNGIVTIGNAVTVAGLLIVAVGLWLVLRGNYGYGLALIAVGRFCDLLDGWLANYTGTKSPLGEIVDATADKLETLGAAIVLVVVGLLPWWLAGAVIALQFVIALVSRIAWGRGRTLHPSRLGKLSMAAAWLGLVLFILPKALGLSENLGHITLSAAYLVSSVSLAMSLYVGASYARQAFSRR
jgi:cardiolipin synthase